MRTAVKRATYWGIITPEDHGEPEMFFRDEQFALASLATLNQELPPGERGMVRIVRVTVEIVDVQNVSVERVAEG